MKDCPRRHPKECYYFRSYDGRCKFGTACFYDHREENRFEPLEKEIEDLQEKYDRLKHIFSEKEVETKILFQQMRDSFKDELKALEIKFEKRLAVKLTKDSKTDVRVTNIALSISPSPSTTGMNESIQSAAKQN